MSRVVVVGAGMGGLAAAARLARLGHEVEVCEQAPTWGGKLGAVARDGFVFDTGPSLLTLPAVYRDLFLKTATSRRDAALEDNVDLVGLDPGFAYRFADGTRATLPGVGSARAAEALGDALGGTAAEDWNRFMRRAAEVWRVTRGPFRAQSLRRCVTQKSSQGRRHIGHRDARPSAGCLGCKIGVDICGLQGTELALRLLAPAQEPRLPCGPIAPPLTG